MKGFEIKRENEKPVYLFSRQDVVSAIAHAIYYTANPQSEMCVPSCAYERAEKEFDDWFSDTRAKKAIEALSETKRRNDDIRRERRGMTDEELARYWVISKSGYNTKEFHGKKAMQAFLAGLEEGRPKWHDSRKDPKDLPPAHTTVLDENGDKVGYIDGGKWEAYSEYYERYMEVDLPIAWCDVPTFNEWLHEDEVKEVTDD